MEYDNVISDSWACCVEIISDSVKFWSYFNLFFFLSEEQINLGFPCLQPNLFRQSLNTLFSGHFSCKLFLKN